MKYLDTSSKKVYNTIEEWEADQRKAYFKNVEEDFELEKELEKRRWKEEYWKTEEFSWNTMKEFDEYVSENYDWLERFYGDIIEARERGFDPWFREKYYREYTDQDEREFQTRMQEEWAGTLEIEEELFADYLDCWRDALEVIEG